MIKKLEFKDNAERNQHIANNPTFRIKEVQRFEEGNWIILTDEPEINKTPPTRAEFDNLLARIIALENK